MGVAALRDVTVTSRVCDAVIGRSFQLSLYILYTCDHYDVPVYGTDSYATVNNSSRCVIRLCANMYPCFVNK